MNKADFLEGWRATLESGINCVAIFPKGAGKDMHFTRADGLWSAGIPVFSWQEKGRSVLSLKEIAGDLARSALALEDMRRVFESRVELCDEFSVVRKRGRDVPLELAAMGVGELNAEAVWFGRCGGVEMIQFEGVSFERMQEGAILSSVAGANSENKKVRL